MARVCVQSGGWKLIRLRGETVKQDCTLIDRKLALPADQMSSLNLCAVILATVKMPPLKTHGLHFNVFGRGGCRKTDIFGPGESFMTENI